MGLKEQIDADYKAAMKARDDLKISVLRLLRSAIHNAEIDKQRALTEDEILGVIQSEVRKRRESIEAFQQGDRQDLVEREQAELKVLESYLPKALSREELEALVRETIREVGALSVRDMGKVMSVLMPKVRGHAEGREVSELVRQVLEGGAQRE
ncbi:MAG: GatB/YqeY domain-containing protein [Candidatus Fervidibacter sp.]|uniref:GatB/YqeY domain-containing protein n=1 Tax=Candidatus Fervidibacter sp. TaxID=3100871 RepID=UPI00404AFDE7